MINDFLSEIPESTINFLRFADIEEQFAINDRKYKAKYKLLDAFADLVKNECVLNRHYFSFFDIPDLIIRQKYSKKDYKEHILKLLNKIKATYLKDKPD